MSSLCFDFPVLICDEAVFYKDYLSPTRPAPIDYLHLGELHVYEPNIPERIINNLHRHKSYICFEIVTSELVISELTTQKLKKYHKLAQSKTSNLLQKNITVRRAESGQIDHFGNMVIETPDIIVTIEGYEECGVNQSAVMLLDSLMTVATEEGLHETLVTLTLDEYMSMRDLKNEKEARKQIKRDFDSLERISFKCKGADNKRWEYLEIKISGGTKGLIKNGDLLFRFNPDFFSIFKIHNSNRYLFMYFPHEALQGNIKKHPHKYWFARKIAEHKRMNLGKDNENVIGVRTLIESCPNFPTYEQVMASNRNITDRIIKPFERDMDELHSVFEWEYSDSIPTKYNEFIKSKVKIRWLDYPEQAVRGLRDKKVERKNQTAQSKPKKNHKR